jgi:two-component system sensor histidine kinase AtoS
VLSLKIVPSSNLPINGKGLIITVEDITEIVTWEQYVILSEKLVARGEMASSMAHKLNNHLSIIANNAELLAINVKRERYDKVRFNSRSITDSVFRIKQFIEKLVDFSRPEPEYINYDIKHLIEDVLFSLQIQPRFKSIHFTINLAEHIPAIEVDVGQIKQVLLDLLYNASDAIENRAAREFDNCVDFKRKIEIQASFDDTKNLLSVVIEDNGVGMSEDTLGKIFDLHFTTKKGGHGLGLYNCKKIVAQHGGNLEAISTVGKGSTLTLVLPRVQKK